MAQTLCFYNKHSHDVGRLVVVVASVCIYLGIGRAPKTHLVHRLFSAFGVGIEHGITALIACAIGLLLWSHVLPERRVGGNALNMKQTDDYARYFDLPEQEIEQGRSQKLRSFTIMNLVKSLELNKSNK